MSYNEEMSNRQSMSRNRIPPDYCSQTYKCSGNDSQQKVRQNRDRRQQRKQRGK